MDINSSENTYLLLLFGPEGADRESAAECAELGRAGEWSFVDRTDEELFSPKDFRELILNKVVTN